MKWAKITANKKGIDATLPYFIPGPPPLGTFGAVIMQKSLPPNRDALFDIGADGPIARAPRDIHFVRGSASADLLVICNLYFCCTSRQQRLLNITRPLHLVCYKQTCKTFEGGIENERSADSDDILFDVHCCVSDGSVSNVSRQLSMFLDRTSYKRIHPVLECRL